MKKRLLALAIIVPAISGVLTRPAFSGEKVRVVHDGVEIKLGNEVLASFNAGTELEVLTRKGEWVGVRFYVEGQKKSGWIHQSNLEAVVVPGLKFAFTTRQGPKQADIPDLMAFVRIRGIDNIIGKAQQAAMQINPMIGGMISAAAIGQGLGNPQLLGIDKARPLALIILNPLKYAQPVVLLLPVTDFEAIPREGPAARIAYAELGSYAMAGQGQGMEPAFETVSGALNGLQGIPLDGMQGDLELVADVNRVMEAAGPKIEEGMQQMKNAMQMAGQMGGAGMNPAVTAKILETEIDWFLGLVEGTRELSLSLKIDPQGIRLRNVATPNAGSDLDQVLKSVSAPKHTLAASLPKTGQVFSYSISIGKSKIMDMFMDLGTKIMNAMELDKQTKEQMEQANRMFMELFTGNAAASFSGGGQGIAILYSIGIKPDGQFRDQYRNKIHEMMKGMTGFYQKMGNPVSITPEPKTRKKGDVLIDTYGFNIELAPAMQKNPVARKQMEMMKKLYGDPAIFELAYLKDQLLFVMGAGASDTMNQFIDAAQKQGGTMNPDLQEAQKLFEPGGHIYGALSIKEALKLADQMIAAFAPGGAPAGHMNIPIQGPPLAIYGRAKDGKWEGEMFVPLQPIAAVQAYVMQKMMQMRKPPAQPGGGQPPQGF